MTSSHRPFSRFVNPTSGDDSDSACLRPIFALLFSEPDSCPDLQTRKGPTKNAVLVEVELASVVRNEKSVALAREDPDYASLWERFMAFYVAPLATSIVLQASGCRFECIVNGRPKILMRKLRFRILLNRSFT